MNDNDLINPPEPKKTFDGHVIGEIIVDEGGIYKVIDTGDEKCYSVTTIMPRGTFVEAYNKYIKNEAVERPKGEWLYNQYDCNPNIGNWHCSECRQIVFGGKGQKPYYNFCPNCGADMRKGGADNE